MAGFNEHFKWPLSKLHHLKAHDGYQDRVDIRILESRIGWGSLLTYGRVKSQVASAHFKWGISKV